MKGVVGFVTGSVIFVGYSYISDTQKENYLGKFYEKFLMIEPTNAQAVKAVLYVKMKRGKTKEAVKDLEKFIASMEEEPNQNQ